MSKHDHKKQDEQDVIKEENDSQQVDSKDESHNNVEQIMKQVQELTETILVKEKHISALEEEIKNINQDYVKRISDKANEANIMLKNKIEEITAKTKQELDTHKKYAIEKQAGDLIDIVNQFELALSYTPTDEKIANYQMGFKMFLTMLKNLLSSLGIDEIKINIGDEFNPEFMECFEFVNSNELSDHTISKIMSKGYKLYDRFVKPAAVYVVKKRS
jgi:molecular chaperone GrpE